MLVLSMFYMFLLIKSNSLQTRTIYFCRGKRTDFKCWIIPCHFPRLCTQLYLWHLLYWMKLFDIKLNSCDPWLFLLEQPSTRENKISLRKSLRSAHLSSAVDSHSSTFRKLLKEGHIVISAQGCWMTPLISQEIEERKSYVLFKPFFHF